MPSAKSLHTLFWLDALCGERRDLYVQEQRSRLPGFKHLTVVEEKLRNGMSNSRENKAEHAETVDPVGKQLHAECGEHFERMRAQMKLLEVVAWLEVDVEARDAFGLDATHVANVRTLIVARIAQAQAAGVAAYNRLEAYVAQRDGTPLVQAPPSWGPPA